MEYDTLDVSNVSYRCYHLTWSIDFMEHKLFKILYEVQRERLYLINITVE